MVWNSTAGFGGMIDAAGQHHAPAPSARIVSLVPSLTELLFDLDLGARVVGRTRYCTQPAAAVSTVPDIGGTKQPDLTRLMALNPTHVIVNIDENAKETVDRIRDAGITVIVTHPNTPMDNVGLYRLLGEIFDRRANADRLESAFLSAHRGLLAAAGDWPERQVLYLIWRKPWMTVRPDTYIGQMLALARLRVVPIGDDGPRYPSVAIDRRLLETIDLVLFPTEPYAFEDKHVQAFREAWGRPGLHLCRIDGGMVSWYGSRAISGLDYLRTFRETLE